MIHRRHLLLSAPALLGACAALDRTPPMPPIPPTPEGLAAGQQRPWLLSGAGYERLWVWLPQGYEQRREPWPLLVFLHGSGERGQDLQKVKVHGPPMWADKGIHYPLVLASPQLEDGGNWEPDKLHALLLALQSRLHVDPARSLGTGLSRGGHGLWSWASRYPRDLAAIAPVCGYGDATQVHAMRDVPVRAYHGDKDTVVPLANQQACVEALRAAGGQASLTIYPGVGHDAWTPAYQDPQLLPWLLAQARR